MKNLYIFVAHLDDVEISTYGYIDKHQHEYKNINIIIATTWSEKVSPWLKNLEILKQNISTNINYINLGYDQRKLNTYTDDCKDNFYQCINYKQEFDILTHDSNDVHTDHVVVNNISKGLYKLCNRYITIYSPSSVRFNSNYYIPLSEKILRYKSEAIGEYDHKKEQSYTGNDYYFQPEWVYDNVPRAHVLENYSTALNTSVCEIYNILKWV